jgi:hypothetical protein
MPNYLDVNQMSQRYPAFTPASFRYMIFNADKTGLNKAIIRVGRKVLLKPNVFEEWLEDQNGGAA